TVLRSPTWRFALFTVGARAQTPAMRFPLSLRLVTLGSALAILAGCESVKLPPPSSGDVVRWEKDIAAFEAADRSNRPPGGAILFTGISSIRRWTNLAETFPEFQVINRGFGGSQTADSVAFVDRIVTPYHPREIIFYAGGNDINAKKTPEQVAADFEAF